MIAVTGATGTTGSELVRLLKEKDEPFRAVARTREKVAALQFATEYAAVFRG